MGTQAGEERDLHECPSDIALSVGRQNSLLSSLTEHAEISGLITTYSVVLKLFSTSQHEKFP